MSLVRTNSRTRLSPLFPTADDMLLLGGLAAAVVSFYGYIRGYGRLGKSGEYRGGYCSLREPI
jgi:hypothetical protein